MKTEFLSETLVMKSLARRERRRGDYDKEKKQDYFTFIEVGAKKESDGKSSQNRLYINSDGTLSGTNYKGTKKYKVSEVRYNTTKK
jgi:hypothetical protein